MNAVLEVASHFQYEGTPVSAEACHVGHINSTYFITCAGEKTIRYTLQKINTVVFNRPVEVVENMINVCEFLKQKSIAEGGDPERETLTLIPCDDGKMYYLSPEGEYWRSYKTVEGVTTYNLAETPEMFRAAACAFGRFFNRLADYPADNLYTTIPNFHNTVSRFADLKRAVEEDRVGRAKEVAAEIGFAMDHENICSYLMDGIADGRFKLGVTHNDTKLNNVLFDLETNKGLCIIDLDTVMPGSLLFDFGDAIRFGASSALEDETDLSRVYVDTKMFEAYVDGFMSELRASLNEDEIRAFPMAARVITFEIGLRFLTDYLNGDVYFRTAYPTHNLDRARNQFKLVADGEAKYDELCKIVEKYI